MKQLCAIAVLAALSAGPAFSQQQVIDEIAVRVNGDIILKSDIERRKRELRKEMEQSLSGPELDKAFQEESKELVGTLIDETLLLQIAKEQGMSGDGEVAKTMEQMRKQYRTQLLADYGNDKIESLEKFIQAQGEDLAALRQFIRTRALTRQVIQHEVYAKMVISTEESRSYYEAHKDKYERPAGVQISAVIVARKSANPDQEKAQVRKMEEAMAAIKRGDRFEDVAQKFSEDDSASDGGLIGFFKFEELEKDLDAELVAEIKKLSKGQTTGIVTSPERMIIVKVDDRHQGGILAFELAQDDIWQDLMSERAPPKTKEYIEKLRKEGYIRIAEGYTDSRAVAKPAPSGKK